MNISRILKQFQTTSGWPAVEEGRAAYWIKKGRKEELGSNPSSSQLCAPRQVHPLSLSFLICEMGTTPCLPGSLGKLRSAWHIVGAQSMCISITIREVLGLPSCPPIPPPPRPLISGRLGGPEEQVRRQGWIHARPPPC